MGQVERSSELTLSFWFSLDNQNFEDVFPNPKRNGEVGHSGKILMVRIINPNRPMILDKRGEFIHEMHKPCPVLRTEILNDPSWLDKKNIRNNPNCFTGGLEEFARFRAQQKKTPEVNHQSC